MWSNLCALHILSIGRAATIDNNLLHFTESAENCHKIKPNQSYIKSRHRSKPAEKAIVNSRDNWLCYLVSCQMIHIFYPHLRKVWAWRRLIRSCLGWSLFVFEQVSDLWDIWERDSGWLWFRRLDLDVDVHSFQVLFYLEHFVGLLISPALWAFQSFDPQLRRVVRAGWHSLLGSLLVCLSVCLSHFLFVNVCCCLLFHCLLLRELCELTQLQLVSLLGEVHLWELLCKQLLESALHLEEQRHLWVCNVLWWGLEPLENIWWSLRTLENLWGAWDVGLALLGVLQPLEEPVPAGLRQGHAQDKLESSHLLAHLCTWGGGCGW